MARLRTYPTSCPRLLLPLLTIVILLLYPLPVQATDYQTRIWVNQVPAYSQLSKCAVQPVSTIVRDMVSGCGDGSRFTSYKCFCTSSFFKARFDISTAVLAGCGSSLKAQVTSAIQVFEDYCAIGIQNAHLVPTTYAAMVTSTKAAQSTSYITAAPVRETGAS